MLLGAVIEAVTGDPWQVATRKLVLEPLGITWMDYYGDFKLVPGRAEGYSRDDVGTVVRAPFVSITGPGAGGGLSSTAEELFHFVGLLQLDIFCRPRSTRT